MIKPQQIPVNYPSKIDLSILFIAPTYDAANYYNYGQAGYDTYTGSSTAFSYPQENNAAQPQQAITPAQPSSTAADNTDPNSFFDQNFPAVEQVSGSSNAPSQQPPVSTEHSTDFDSSQMIKADEAASLNKTTQLTAVDEAFSKKLTTKTQSEYAPSESASGASPRSTLSYPGTGKHNSRVSQQPLVSGLDPLAAQSQGQVNSSASIPDSSPATTATHAQFPLVDSTDAVNEASDELDALVLGSKSPKASTFASTVSDSVSQSGFQSVSQAGTDSINTGPTQYQIYQQSNSTDQTYSQYGQVQTFDYGQRSPCQVAAVESPVTADYQALQTNTDTYISHDQTIAAANPYAAPTYTEGQNAQTGAGQYAPTQYQQSPQASDVGSQYESQTAPPVGYYNPVSADYEGQQGSQSYDTFNNEISPPVSGANYNSTYSNGQPNTHMTQAPANPSPSQSSVSSYSNLSKPKNRSDTSPWENVSSPPRSHTQTPVGRYSMPPLSSIEDDRASTISFRTNTETKTCVSLTCRRLNEIDANFCSKCGHPFPARLVPPQETIFSHQDRTGSPGSISSAPPPTIANTSLPGANTYERPNFDTMSLGSNRMSGPASFVKPFEDPLKRTGCPLVCLGFGGSLT